MVGDLAVGLPLPVGGDHHRRAVLVGAAHHQHVVAPQAVVAREDVGGHAEAGHVAEVAVARGVGPRGRDQDLAAPGCHAAQSYEAVPGAPCAPSRGGGSERGAVELVPCGAAGQARRRPRRRAAAASPRRRGDGDRGRARRRRRERRSPALRGRPSTSVTSPFGGSAKRSRELGGRAALDLLERLGQLAADGDLALGRARRRASASVAGSRRGDSNATAGQLQPPSSCQSALELAGAPGQEAEEGVAAARRARSRRAPSRPPRGPAARVTGKPRSERGRDEQRARVGDPAACPASETSATRSPARSRCEHARRGGRASLWACSESSRASIAVAASSTRVWRVSSASTSVGGGAARRARAA